MARDIAPIEREDIGPIDATEALVDMTRPDGSKFLLRVPMEHFDRVMNLANGEFGDASINLGGPSVPKPKKG